jgi:O-antigen ligase
VQRAVSFLPVDIDPDARRDAQGTLDWRFQMWKHVIPEIPNYLWIGKGYSFSGLDYTLTQLAVQRGIISSAYEAALISGAYHHGVLTLLLPLGLPGLLAFLWFCWAGLRVLYMNHKYGPEHLRSANTFLISIFCARLVFYIFLYGQFELDLPLFVGIVALSLSLNGGVCRPPSRRDEPAPEPTG